MTKTQLQDICSLITDGSHLSPPTVSFGKPIASVKDMLEYDVDLTSCRRISEKDYNLLVKGNCQPQIGDVLIAKDGSYLKKIFVVEADPEYVVLSSIGIFRPDKNLINPYYLMYYFHLNSFRRYVSNGFVSGTALKRIVLDAFKRIEINIPTLDEQERIINNILPVDKKIKLNEKLLKQLGEYSEKIYRRWFVDFNFPDKNNHPYLENNGGLKVVNGVSIPENWSLDRITSLGEIVAGGTPSTRESKYFTNKGIPWITPKDLSATSNKYITNGAIDITPEGLLNSSAKVLPAGTVLMSSRAPIGYLGIAKNEVTTNQGFKSIVPYEDVCSEYIYYTLKRIMPKILRIGSGSTFKEVSKEMVSKLIVIKPSEDIMHAYKHEIKLISEKIRLLEEENERLINLRNLLIEKNLR